jgi:hypothetical protein
MSHFDEDMDDASLSPDERRELAALPREHVASAALEERIVSALRGARLLGNRAASIRQSVRRRRGWITFAAFAASLVIFASGILVGRRSADAEQVTASSQQRELNRSGTADSMQFAHEVQRAGSEYVSLLEQLPSRSPADEAPSRAEQLGREAARSTLHAAARQLARVSPNDPVAMLLVEGLRPDTRGGQVMWF